MSRNQSKKTDNDKKSSDSDLGATILAGAAVVGLSAVAAYGLYKLFDSIFEDVEKEKDAAEKLDEESCERRQPKPVSTDLNLKINDWNNSFSVLPKTNKDELLFNYEKSIFIEEKFLTPLKRIVEQVQKRFRESIQHNCNVRGIKFEQFIKCGWGRDFFLIKSLDYFTFLVPLTIDYYLFEKIQADYKSYKLSSRHDGLNQLKYKNELLTPTSVAEYMLFSVKNKFEEMLKMDNIVISQVNITGGCIFLICNSSASPAVKVKVKMIPAVKINDNYLVPAENDSSYIWKLFFIDQEDSFLAQFSPLSMSHKIIFSTFVNISLTLNDYFSVLHTEHLKHIMFHLIEDQPYEVDWDLETVFEHFVDFLIELQKCLDRKVLLNVFDESINMFYDLQDMPRKKLQKFIEEIISNKSWNKLLKSGF
ncbi:hypothetical protein HELRODRAFT_167992 [Helobdella robusta]|uniref:Mab-21-like HhH/H2TH-like domain-containing protein n=1 Tax=Helobdella robusta TaxID=6412 RepID=T1F018_HELRO|nr:hypothetical protein HELRODRAFT_167992 [Helobdella robusta]ESO10133.1 hypothetical protein HELRODRAFT_167992 [Helobdella robusta]